MSKVVLLTGVSGTLGTLLCTQLIDGGYTVYGVSRSDKWSEVKEKTNFSDRLHLQQLDVKNEVETLITEHLQSQNPLADAKAQKSPTSLRAHPHPLATLIAPFVETALREQAPLIVADILRQQNSLRR